MINQSGNDYKSCNDFSIKLAISFQSLKSDSSSIQEHFNVNSIQESLPQSYLLSCNLDKLNLTAWNLWGDKQQAESEDHPSA